MKPAGLSLLTYPTLPCLEYPREWLKLIAKLCLATTRFDVQSLEQLCQGGHAAVTRSVLAGCRALGLPHNLNVARTSALYPWVLVLSSVSALRQAIRLRELGRIQHLWAGPNLVVLPTEEAGILSHPMIDRVVVPSEWVARQYLDLLPALNGRVLVWPAGVDVQKAWLLPAVRGQSPHRDLHVLHYKKLSTDCAVSRWFPVYQSVRDRLEDCGCIQSEVVYGSHRRSYYRHMLRQADVMVYWTDAGESQGLALLEAWAMDVPTFVSDNRSALIRGVKTVVSSAPYLSAECGSFFGSAENLFSLLSPFMHVGDACGYYPLRWVEHNMTDKLCVENLISAFCESLASR